MNFIIVFFVFECSHSGDVGKLDKWGFLHITGRIKELLKTGNFYFYYYLFTHELILMFVLLAGGEFVAPVPLENAIKEKCPAIANVMVVRVFGIVSTKIHDVFLLIYYCCLFFKRLVIDDLTTVKKYKKSIQ